MSFLSRHWFTIAIPTTVAVSYAQPEWFRTNGTFQVQDWKDHAVRGMFVCSGLCIPGLQAFRSVFTHHARNAMIQGVSLLAIPLVVAATAPAACTALDLPPAAATGAMFAACLPTTIGLSIALTKAAGGSVLLATFHSALGNTVGPFITPITAALLVGVTTTVDPIVLATKLGTLILLPLGLGLSLRACRPQWFATPYSSKIAGTVQQSLLLITLSNVFSSSFYKRQEQHRLGDNGNGPAPLSLNVLARIGGMMAAYYVCFFSMMTLTTMVMPTLFGGAPTAIAAVYCATQKTAAMGLPMLDLLYGGREDLDVLVTPLLLYHMFQILFGSMVGPYALRACLKQAS